MLYRCDRPGLYMEPTIFSDVEDHMFIAEEESFGPIMVVSKFARGDVDDVIARANNTEFGLASGVFTNDVNKVCCQNFRIIKMTYRLVKLNSFNLFEKKIFFSG